jgi:hypothetical protein
MTTRTFESIIVAVAALVMFGVCRDMLAPIPPSVSLQAGSGSTVFTPRGHRTIVTSASPLTIVVETYGLSITSSDGGKAEKVGLDRWLLGQGAYRLAFSLNGKLVGTTDVTVREITSPPPLTVTRRPVTPGGFAFAEIQVKAVDKTAVIC